VNGGYVLCRPPKEISLLEIINALEGPLDFVDCVGSQTVCSKTQTCAARTVWKELSDSISSILGNLTLQDLLDREEKLFTPSYAI
jgi:Rrf2 family protein